MRKVRPPTVTTSSLVPDDLSGSRFFVRDFERRFELSVLVVVLLPSLLGFRSPDLLLFDLSFGSVLSEVSFDVLVLLRGFSLEPVLSTGSLEVLVLLRGFSARSVLSTGSLGVLVLLRGLSFGSEFSLDDLVLGFSLVFDLDSEPSFERRFDVSPGSLGLLDLAGLSSDIFTFLTDFQLLD